jgi:SagB-type dehydrogenase family enzyme
MILLSAVYERTTAKYGQRGIRYVHMEAGHAAQNVALQAAAMSIGSVMVGAFEDEPVKAIAHLPGEQTPLYIIPVGR